MVATTTLLKEKLLATKNITYHGVPLVVDYFTLPESGQHIITNIQAPVNPNMVGLFQALGHFDNGLHHPAIGQIGDLINHANGH